MGTTPRNPAHQRALNEALNIAIRANDLDMMTNAVDAGADANVLLFTGINMGQIDWVKRAVEHGADVTASMRGLSYGDILRPADSYPAFFWLTTNFHADIGDYLLSKGANIDALSSAGDTALMAAVRMRNKSVIRYLAESGADPLASCANQKFPLQEIEEDTSWYDSSDKVPLIKAMMVTLKNKAAAEPSPAAKVAANDAGVAATSHDIEVNRPIELKKPKPKNTFEL